MKLSQFIWVYSFIFTLLLGCAEDTTSTPDKDINEKSGPDATTTTIPTVIGGTVYYTGYDGVNNFNIFISTSRAVSVHDPSIATAQQVNITIDDATVASQIAQLEAVYSAAGETMSTRRKEFYERRLKNPRIWKIIPLKAGITTISAERERRAESIWEKAEIRTIVVAEYSADQVEAGRQRYEEPIGNTACTQCHNNSFGESVGAPPHLLGRVIEISDSDAAKWISTGAVKDRIASGSHAWVFQNDTEKLATVAYLRSKQTTDEADYARLLFEEEMAETKAEFAASAQ